MLKKYKVFRIGRYKILLTPSKKLFSFTGFLDSKKKVFPWYINKFKELVPKNTKTILGLGMGIGMISHLNLNAEIEYVENDKQMIKIAKEKFDLPKNTQIYSESAEKFLHRKNKKYDVIFYDIFVKNQFEGKFLNLKLKNFLKPEGILIANIVDYKKNLWKYSSIFPKAEFFLRRERGFALPMNIIMKIKKEDF
ncbi:MAG: hypothetical protein ACOCXG_02845 [Nanoarchaeota archaeon]